MSYWPIQAFILQFCDVRYANRNKFLCVYVYVCVCVCVCVCGGGGFYRTIPIELSVQVTLTVSWDIPIGNGALKIVGADIYY